MKNKVFLSNKPKSYLVVILCGIIAGALTLLFNDFPNNDLWLFASFSSGTVGFWMFSTSSIVLLSGKRLTASINAGIYVFEIFTIYYLKTTSLNSVSDITLFTKVLQILLLSLLCGIIFGAMGAVLWSGKSDNIVGSILVSLPLSVVIAEAFLMLYVAVIHERYLFQALLDFLSAFIYMFVFRNLLLKKRTLIFSLIFTVLMCIFFFKFQFPIFIK